ncbi:PglZ domain-containing protein [Gemmatimonadota bacterium]
MPGPVTQYIVDRIEQKLREHLVVVWFDPEHAFENVFEGNDFAGSKRHRYREGYFKLRQEAEPSNANMQAGQPDAERLLIYVDHEPVDDSLNLLFPLEKMGYRHDHTLRQLVQWALRDKVPADQVREWLETPQISLAELDRLAEEGTTIGALATVFGEVSAYEAAFRFLTDEDLYSGIEERELTVALKNLLTKTFGLSLSVDIDGSKQLRDVFAQQLLVREFIDDLPEIPDSLKHLTPINPNMRCHGAVQNLCQRLREHRPSAALYMFWAKETENRFGLSSIELNAKELGERDTFGFEERRALAYSTSLGHEGKWEEAKEWAEEHSRSFWANQDDRRRSQWLAARTALELRLTAEQLQNESKGIRSLAEWVDWYTADAGGWKVDRLARELDGLFLSYQDEKQLMELIDLVLEPVAALEQHAAEELCRALQEGPEGLATLPSQTAIFKNQLEPLLEDDQRVLFVLADALRFEMGQALADSLRDGGSVVTDWAVATLPTITKIGMAALLPGSEEGLEIVEDKAGAYIAIGGKILHSVTDRKKWLEEKYGRQYLDMSLDDSLQLSSGKLKKMVESANLIVLRSQDIDQIGETDSLTHARTLMVHLLDNLSMAIRRLVKAGCEQVVIVADHGYLQRGDLSDAMKIEVPNGEYLETHRRCAIGRNLSAGPDWIQFQLSDFGVKSELEIVFPRGINVFKVPGGNLNYLHGGVSLQEMIIPIVRYTSSPQRDEEERHPTVTLRMTADKVTNSFFQVTLTYHTGDLFAQHEKRQFRIVVKKEKRVVGTIQEASVGFDVSSKKIELSDEEECVAMIGLSEPIEGEGMLVLEVIDAAVGEPVETLEVPYDLSF